MSNVQASVSVPPPADRGSLAPVGERARARAIDAVILFVLAIPVTAIAGLFSPDTTSTTSDGSDPASTVAGLVLLAIFVAYDPLTTAWFGATPGKRATGLQVVTEGTDTPAPPWRLLLRAFAEWAMFAFAIVPGVLDVRSAQSDRLMRTWHDRLAGTLVVRSGRNEPPPPPTPLTREPWASAVTEAQRAQRRFAESTTSVGSGPLRERFVAVARHVDACVAECAALARRGDQLATLAGTIDHQDVARRAEAAAADAAAHPGDSTRSDLASALANEAASSSRVAELVATTERNLRRLIAQLNDAVNRAIEVTYSDSPESGFASLVDELESLRLGFVEARQVAAVGD
jgi:uncharacterized RDD family membrane protein YckC